MKTLYHATSVTNLSSIVAEGIHTGIDGCVYFAETKDDAIKFVSLRYLGQPIVVFEVNIPDEDERLIQESFDHSQKFYQCRAWLIPKNIPSSYIKSAWRYE